MHIVTDETPELNILPSSTLAQVLTSWDKDTNIPDDIERYLIEEVYDYLKNDPGADKLLLRAIEERLAEEI